MEVIEVDPREGWASFKFIGATFMKSLVVSIDEHPMWIYEVDGHYYRAPARARLPLVQR